MALMGIMEGKLHVLLPMFHFVGFEICQQRTFAYQMAAYAHILPFCSKMHLLMGRTQMEILCVGLLQKFWALTAALLKKKIAFIFILFVFVFCLFFLLLLLLYECFILLVSLHFFYFFYFHEKAGVCAVVIIQLSSHSIGPSATLSAVKFQFSILFQTL